MITALKQQLLTNWHPTRWVALGIGSFLAINWFVSSAPAAGLLALFFLFQAITNTGCLGGRCTVPEHTVQANADSGSQAVRTEDAESDNTLKREQ